MQDRKKAKEMKKKKILVLIAIAALLAVLGVATLAIKSYSASQKVTVQGQVKSKFHIPANKVDSYKKTMDFTEQQALVNLDKSINEATDPSQKKMLEDTKKRMQGTSPSQNLSMNSDGSADMVTPLPFLQVTIDHQTVTTDSKGNYKIMGVSKGRKEIQVSYKGGGVFQKNADVKSDITVNLEKTVNW